MSTEPPPMVSVVIPTYNSAKTLDRCIKSVFTQTYTNWEIVIVDGYSSDETRNIALEWCKRFPAKCRYYDIPKRFQAAKRNFGVNISRGDRIYFHDSDQYLSPKVLEECVDAVRQDYDAVGVPVEFIIPKSYLERSIFYSIHSLILETTDYPNFIKKDDWMRLGGLDETISYVEDIDFYLRFKATSLTMTCVNAVSFHDQPYTLKWIVYKTISHVKGMQVLNRKIGISNVNVKEIMDMKLLGSLLRMFKEHRPYLPGIVFAILVRLTAKMLVKCLTYVFGI